MANFYKDNADLRYYVEKGIDWEPLMELVEDYFRHDDGFKNADEAVEFYVQVFEMIGEFVATEIDPHTSAIDHEEMKIENGEVEFGPMLEQIFQKIRDLDVIGLPVPRELGGLNAPMLAYFIISELISRADTAVMAHHGFHTGIAMAMLVYCFEEGSVELDDEGRIVTLRFEDAIREIVSGKEWGSMDITEPDAGSDMANLRCKATQDDDGNWFVSGQKIFITSGHGKYHIVIAKTEDDKGLDGLSTFMVPAFTEDENGNRVRLATVDRLEEKLGHHASATCAITFKDTPAHLIGNRGEGFKHMLLLMNNARIGVGMECIGIAEASIHAARAYAEERKAFGKTIDRHEMIADYFDEMESDVVGMRALTINAAFYEEMAYRCQIAEQRNPQLSEIEKARLEKQRQRFKRKSRRLTPLLKYFGAEKCVEMARRSIQIHGGAGFTTEYPAEKLLRDAMVMPIYEGTSQIQSLMAMKDTLSYVFKNPQAFVAKLAKARVASLTERDPRAKKLAHIQFLSLQAQQHLIRKTALDKFKNVRHQPLTQWANALQSDWDPKRDFSYAMLHAERLTKILADEAICEILHEQGTKHPERFEWFDRYIERAEPRCKYLYDVISTTGDRMIDSIHGAANQAAAE